jgi:hypothetical protein
LKRFEDWPARLDAAIDSARVKPFAWGGHDCALFAADVVLAITGKDFGAQWRGSYHSAAQAMRRLRPHGGLPGLVTKVLGDPVKTEQAMRGDVVLMCGEQGPTLGICLGANCAFTGLEGLVFVTLRECEQVWHV